MAFPWSTVHGPTLNAGLVTLWFSRGSGPVLLGNLIVLWFFREGGSGPPAPPSGSAHAHTHNLARALLLDYWRVRKLSTPSPKDVDCIIASYIAFRSSNKTQFCSMVMHVHHKSDLSEGSDEFAHFARIQKVLPEGSDFDGFFCLFVFSWLIKGETIQMPP